MARNTVGMSRTQSPKASPATPWFAGEDPLALDEVWKLVNGKPIHRKTPYRWSVSGLRGVRLRSFRFGRRMMTTKQELERWMAEVSACYAEGSR